METYFWVPAVHAAFEDFSLWASRMGYRIYGTSAHASQEYNQVAYRQPCVLLLGSEREGLSPAQRAVCQDFVRIPMGGRSTSLNLSIAAGVMLYAMLPMMRVIRPD